MMSYTVVSTLYSYSAGVHAHIQPTRICWTRLAWSTYVPGMWSLKSNAHGMQWRLWELKTIASLDASWMKATTLSGVCVQ